jgi:hypothetical protein
MLCMETRRRSKSKSVEVSQVNGDHVMITLCLDKDTCKCLLEVRSW